MAHAGRPGAIPARRQISTRALVLPSRCGSQGPGARPGGAAQPTEPLVGIFDDRDLDRVAAALGIILGTDSMLALTDGVGLSADDAKTVMLDAARWLLAGAIAELDEAPHGR